MYYVVVVIWWILSRSQDSRRMRSSDRSFYGSSSYKLHHYARFQIRVADILWKEKKNI